MTVQYLLAKSKADNKSSVQIIDELVSEKVAAAAIYCLSIKSVTLWTARGL